MKYNYKKNALIICLLCLTNLSAIGNFAYAQIDLKVSTPVEILMAEPELAGSSKSASLFKQAKKYHDGDGVKQDFLRAKTLYLKSASMGNNDARINLGYLYFMGEGVNQSYIKARNWYLSAANNGSKDAQLNLAMIYQNGFGVPKDENKAAYWRTYDQKKAIKKKPTAKPVANAPRKPAIAKRLVKSKPVAPKIKVNTPKISDVKSEKTKKLANTVIIVEPPNSGPHAKQITPRARSFISQTIKRKQETSPTNILGQTLAIPQGDQMLLNAQVLPTSMKESMIEVGDTIAALKPKSSVPNSLKSFRGLTRATDKEPQILSQWFSNITLLLMLMLVVITSIWFFTQFTKLGKQREAHVFARAFYAHHRDRLRVNYLRYPKKHRQINTMDDSWATALCVLMVRFAQSEKGENTLVGLQSNRIIQALKESPYKAKQAVFPFVKVTQHRIFEDIQAHEYKFKDKPESGEVSSVEKVKDVSPVVKIKEVLTVEKAKEATPIAKVKEVVPGTKTEKASGSHAFYVVKLPSVSTRKQEATLDEDIPPNITK